MNRVPLVRDRELATPAFVRDLRAFLNLGSEVLLTVSQIGDSADGFAGSEQFLTLSETSGVSLNEARGALRVAEYLYNRVTELGVDAATAADEISFIGSTIQDPVEVSDNQRKAIATILSYKDAYERSSAVSKALREGPHFTGFSGTWTVKYIPIRGGEVVRVPVLALSVAWHDGAGNSHEAFVQLSVQDWEALKSEVENLTNKQGTGQDLSDSDVSSVS